MRVERIGITQNYNNSNKQNFTANFSEKEILSMTREAKKHYGAAGIPMLDILLGYLEKIGGKVAHIKTTKQESGSIFGTKLKVLTIDKKVVHSVDEDTPGLDLLEGYLVGEPEPYIKDFVRMPERIYESRWFERGARNEESLLRHALPKKVSAKPTKPKQPVDWTNEGITPPKPAIAILEKKVEYIKPYSVVKEIYKDKTGRNIRISNIDILAKSRTEEGIAELNAIEKNLNKTSKQIFAQKRKAAKLEIEKPKQKPKVIQ